MFQVSKRPLLILVTPDRLPSIAVNSESRMYAYHTGLVAMNRMPALSPHCYMLKILLQPLNSNYLHRNHCTILENL